MATKKEINLFVKEERNKAIKAIEDKYSDIMKTREYELLEERGFSETATRLQAKINELHAVISEFELSIQDDDILSIGTWNMLARRLSEFAGEGTYLEKVRYECGYDKTNIPLIKNERRLLTMETSKNYDNLLNAISKMTAVNAMLHLEQLGFDTTPLKTNATETALLALVDKTKLFYPRKTDEETPQEESGE